MGWRVDGREMSESGRLPGELFDVRSIVPVTTVTGHKTSTKWLSYQISTMRPQDASTLQPSACHSTLLHAG